MTDDGYQGWTNWETWNVALWLGNDEGAYEMARDFVSSGEMLHGEISEDDTDDFVRQMFPDGTPDMDDASELDDVDYAEIRDMLVEDFSDGD